MNGFILKADAITGFRGKVSKLKLKNLLRDV